MTSTIRPTVPATTLSTPQPKIRSTRYALTSKINIDVDGYRTNNFSPMTDNRNMTDDGLNFLDKTQNFKQRPFYTSLAAPGDAINLGTDIGIPIINTLVNTDSVDHVEYQHKIYPMSKGNYADDTKIYNNPEQGENINIRINDEEYRVNHTHDINYIVSLKEHIESMYGIIIHYIYLGKNNTFILETLKRVLFVDHFCTTQTSMYVDHETYYAINNINLGTSKHINEQYNPYEYTYAKVNDKHINVDLLNPYETQNIRHVENPPVSGIYNTTNIPVIRGNIANVVIIPNCHPSARLLNDTTIELIINRLREKIKADQNTTTEHYKAFNDALPVVTTTGGSISNNKLNQPNLLRFILYNSNKINSYKSKVIDDNIVVKLDIDKFINDFSNKNKIHIEKCHLNDDFCQCKKSEYNIDNVDVSPFNKSLNKYDIPIDNINNDINKRIKEAYDIAIKLYKNKHINHDTEIRQNIIDMANYLEFFMAPIDTIKIINKVLH